MKEIAGPYLESPHRRITSLPITPLNSHAQKMKWLILYCQILSDTLPADTLPADTLPAVRR
jgi:hypothetical protein